MSTITTKDGTQIYYKDWGPKQEGFKGTFYFSGSSCHSPKQMLAHNRYAS